MGLYTGNPADAEVHLRTAIDIADGKYPLMAGVFRGSLAMALAEQGEFEEYPALFAEGERLIRDIHNYELAKLYCKRGIVAHQAGDAMSAAESYQLAMETAGEEAGLRSEAEVGELGHLGATLRKLLG
jgi:hypothetical protein